MSYLIQYSKPNDITQIIDQSSLEKLLKFKEMIELDGYHTKVFRLVEMSDLDIMTAYDQELGLYGQA